jgi:NADPH:quinone reductase-like Zn-dependent oxidoreductase
MIGQRVLAMTPFGGYSEMVCVPLALIAGIPDTVSDEAAAALPVNFLTAHHMLVRLGNLQASDTVLVHGAAGGVGIAAVQLSSMRGATVLGTASASKHRFLASLGVEAFDYREAGWPDRVRAATGGRGIDIALDPIGGRSFRTTYRLLAPGGRLFCFGVSAMAPSERPRIVPALRTLVTMPRFHPIRLMNDNRAVIGINLGRLWSEPDLLRPQLRALVEHARDEEIAPLVDSTFSFAHAAAAHVRLQTRENVGKVLLHP